MVFTANRDNSNQANRISGIKKRNLNKFGKLILIITFLGFSLSCEKNNSESKNTSSKQNESGNSVKAEKQKFTVPDFNLIPKDALGESITRGKDYLENTHLKLPKHAKSNINCTSCHLNVGRTQNAGPWVGIVARFPQFRARSAKVDTLKFRVNDCFERSLNGVRLPEDSQEMTDIISYMTWLSNGYVIGEDMQGSGMPKLVVDRKPDLIHGKEVYQAKCVACHQASGEGLKGENAKIIYPPLWGKDSFNVGAGMARLQTAAGFVKHNMPQGQEGTLTDEEAWDVAAYFTTQPRPDFAKKKLDWAKGDKPKDARY